MKTIQYQLILFLLLLLVTFTNNTIAQGETAPELTFEVNKVHPYISITKDALANADSVAHLNHRFKSEWIKDYLSVAILTTHNGMTHTATGQTAILTKEQKENMAEADAGTAISVKVNYMPANNLKHNDPKEEHFTFTIDPSEEASYPEGSMALEKYLKKNAIDLIDKNSFSGYDLTAIQFTVNEIGEIVNAKVFDSPYQTYNNTNVNGLLLEAIRKMPCWKPAEYADGTKVAQDFMFTVGNMESCVVPLLSIRRY